MDTTFLSIALIHRNEENQSQYLVCSSSGSDPCWSPILGTRLEKESFRDTIIREISWVLDLDRQKDFVVSNMSASAQEYVEENVDGAHHYAIAFYRARLYTKAAREKIEKSTSARWVSPQELCDGRFGESNQIDKRVVGWINQWSVINAWE